MHTARRLLLSESGADATEYALLASLVAMAIIAGATLLGGKLNGIFNYIPTQLVEP